MYIENQNILKQVAGQLEIELNHLNLVHFTSLNDVQRSQVLKVHSDLQICIKRLKDASNGIPDENIHSTGNDL